MMLMSSIFSDTVGRINKDDCWLWAGKTDKSGHGRVYAGQINGKPFPRQQAYRVMYENFVAPIPEGYVVDHLCEVPQCINPSHLEAVTHAENTRRHYRNITHCINGHELTEDNIVWKYRSAFPDNPTRLCKTCRDKPNVPERKPHNVYREEREL